MDENTFLYFWFWHKTLWLIWPHVSFNSLQSCTLSFSPNNTEGAYAVQLVMEDFPRQAITLTATSGTQVSLTTNNAISKLPVQFAVRGKIPCTYCCIDIQNNHSLVDPQWVNTISFCSFTMKVICCPEILGRIAILTWEEEKIMWFQPNSLHYDAL